MSKKITVPEVDIEIGENLYLRLKEVSYYPGSPAVMYYKDGSGSPEDPAEIDWKEQCLIIRKVSYKNVYSEILNKNVMSKDINDYDFSIDDEFANNYYDELLEATEEILNEQ